MGLFQRLFGKAKEDVTSRPVGDALAETNDSQWERLPGFIPADEADYPIVSVIATAIAAGDYPDSQFVVKRILQRNPEALKLSIIASSIAAGESNDCQLAVKAIYQKKL